MQMVRRTTLPFLVALVDTLKSSAVRFFKLLVVSNVALVCLQHNFLLHKHCFQATGNFVVIITRRNVFQFMWLDNKEKKCQRRRALFRSKLNFFQLKAFGALSQMRGAHGTLAAHKTLTAQRKCTSACKKPSLSDQPLTLPNLYTILIHSDAQK